MSTKVIESIYTELDVLLDTRLGTVAKINPEQAESLLASGKYHNRQSDIFDGVDMLLYKTVYASRNTETLARAMVTEGIQLMRHLVGVLTEQAIVRPYHDGVKIVVNTYPYKLTNVEQDEIGQAMAAWMQALAPVELVHIAPEDLTPRHCKSSYAMMIVYEFEEWMNVHAEAFKQTRLPEVTMFAPAIYFNKVPSDKELEEIVKESTHPMRALELLASPIIDLKLIDVKFFSILSNK